MLTYDLEKRGDLARYDYLYRCVKEDILSGRLRSGEKLPSKRALAHHLETAVVTVENAYAQLVAEGYVTAEEKRGYFVNAVEPYYSMGEPADPQEREHDGKVWLLDLKRGGSGTEGFPFSVWARLMRRVLTEQGERLLRALPHSGAYELRLAISRAGTDADIEEKARAEYGYMKEGELRFEFTNPALLDEYTDEETEILKRELTP